MTGQEKKEAQRGQREVRRHEREREERRGGSTCAADPSKGCTCITHSYHHRHA